jgi:hypothetical protein
MLHYLIFMETNGLPSDFLDYEDLQVPNLGNLDLQETINGLRRI